ncbi:aminotransferase class V-fold PLP-dependent enzyme [Clostridium sp.]|uniref:aminotransferase class V-fold PLP-dependent enzyme n=1 Tax=Clostridium sp. TaxID=1506 RepID=UPI0028FECF6D|nr:aminotransferase class V-fold PLP-dependent enzyme [Clostridium sp.]MDU1843516.1 aminotransferase class V-fold PLP-dependent enzyme [Clostridium sp.]
MKTFPLNSISLQEAMELQFKIIDTVTKYFDGREVLALGDLGVVKGLNKPTYTQKVEKVFADVFDAEASILVRGAGTGAIRWGLISFMKSGEKILVHEAPIYPTSKVTIETMGLKVVKANFNNINDIKRVINENPDIKGALVQRIITDDNYAALKIKKIGNQCGADLGSFSCFKILGPEGVGVLIGKKELIDKVYSLNYSGGSQVQGFEAMEALRGLVYAPVSLAIQSQVNEELVERLKAGEIPEIKDAFLVNAQSKVLIVELKENIAEKVLEITPKYGAASHPVGSESKYEFAPMMYRVSGTFRAADPTLEKRMIRINPMRSGADTIIRILNSAIKEAMNEA